MPNYNGEEFLDDAIKSVIAQTFKDWELLIADDCSTDKSVSIINHYSQEDQRIKLIKNLTQGGPAISRNNALKNANGRYVAFLDSDDIWLSTKLQKQINFMSSFDCPISYTEFRRINEDGTRVGRQIRVLSTITYQKLLKNTCIATSSAVIDRSLTGEISFTPGFGYDDFILWLTLLKKGFAAHAIHEDLLRYRVVSGSVSGKKSRSIRWVWNIYRNHENLGRLYSIWCLLNYGWRALRKRLFY